MVNKPLQWHCAFQAILQIELEEDQDCLQFLKEYNLTEKPLRIDTLVVKKIPGQAVRKNIGRIFRQYNVMEYKGPGDYLSVNDFYKVMGYTGVLQSNTKREQEIRPDDLTVSFIGFHYPRKLIGFLKARYSAGVEEVFPGIYYVSGLMFPTQVVVQNQLSKLENIWLSRLCGNLGRQDDIEVLAKEYKGKDKDPLYSAAMDLIVRANWNVYEEGIEMCDALNELFAEKMDKSKQEWKAEAKAEGIAEAILAFLDHLGDVPAGLRRHVLSQKNLEVLNKWFEIAIKSDTVRTFRQNTGL